MKKLLTALAILISLSASAQFPKTYWGTTTPTGSSPITPTFRLRGTDSTLIPSMLINGKYYDVLTWTNFLLNYYKTPYFGTADIGSNPGIFVNALGQLVQTNKFSWHPSDNDFTFGANIFSSYGAFWGGTTTQSGAVYQQGLIRGIQDTGRHVMIGATNGKMYYDTTKYLSIYNPNFTGFLSGVNTTGANFNENIRLQPAANGHTTIQLGANSSGSGTIPGQWSLDASPLSLNRRLATQYNGTFVYYLDTLGGVHAQNIYQNGNQVETINHKVTTLDNSATNYPSTSAVYTAIAQNATQTYFTTVTSGLNTLTVSDLQNVVMVSVSKGGSPYYYTVSTSPTGSYYYYDSTAGTLKFADVFTSNEPIQVAYKATTLTISGQAFGYKVYSTFSAVTYPIISPSIIEVLVDETRGGNHVFYFVPYGGAAASTDLRFIAVTQSNNP